MNTKWTVAATVAFLALGCIVAVAADPLAAPALGHLTYDPGAEAEPAGGAADAIPNPSLVHTGNEPALLELANGQVLWIGPSSSVFLELAPAAHATVRVSVRRGEVSITDSRGQAMRAGKNSYFELGPAGVRDLADSGRVARDRREGR